MALKYQSSSGRTQASPPGAIGIIPDIHGRYMFNPNACIGAADTYHVAGPDPCIACGPTLLPPPTVPPSTATAGGIIMGYLALGPPGEFSSFGNYFIDINLITGVVTAPYGYGPPGPLHLKPGFVLQVSSTVSASPPSWSQDLPVVTASDVIDPITGVFDPVATQQGYKDAQNKAVNTAFSVFGMTPP